VSVGVGGALRAADRLTVCLEGAVSRPLVEHDQRLGTGDPAPPPELLNDLPEPLDVEKKMQLIAEIAAASGRPVDLVDLRSVGEPLLGQILKHGQQIRGQATALAGLMQRHVYAMEDFMPYVERMLDERKRAWIG